MEEKAKERTTVHMRWMIRRDMSEVLQIESSKQDPWAEEDFLRCLHQRNNIGMIAEHGEKVVGFMFYELHKHHLCCVNFMVDRAWLGRGVGRQMIDKMKSKLSSHRRTKLLLEVPESNTDCLLWLKRLGFQARPMAHGDDVIVMAFSERSEDESTLTNRIAKYLDEMES